jgi:hypothetical protein
MIMDTSRARRARNVALEAQKPMPAAAAGHSGEEDQWAGWEAWLRSHLDNEREHTEARILDAVRQVVDGTVKGLEGVGDEVAASNRELREQLRDLKLEVARLSSLAAELRTDPVDLPARSLRSLREVN